MLLGVLAIAAPQQHASGWRQRLSPFACYAGGHPLQHGIPIGDAEAALAASIALVGAGTLAFSRRDVSV